jgi:hypothetical protein
LSSNSFLINDDANSLSILDAGRWESCDNLNFLIFIWPQYKLLFYVAKIASRMMKQVKHFKLNYWTRPKMFNCIYAILPVESANLHHPSSAGFHGPVAHHCLIPRMQLRLLDVEADMGLFPLKQKANARVAFHPSRRLCSVKWCRVFSNYLQ